MASYTEETRAHPRQKTMSYGSQILVVARDGPCEVNNFGVAARFVLAFASMEGTVAWPRYAQQLRALPFSGLSIVTGRG